MNSTQLSTGRIAVLAGIVFAFSCRSGFADERTDFFKTRFVSFWLIVVGHATPNN